MPKQTFFNLPEEKRERIIGCAIREFSHRGYKLASISRMVAEAGIAKGSFYQYFEDKDDLYSYIFCTRIADRKLQTYQREMKRLEDLSLTGFLRLVFHQQLEQFSREPELMRMGLDILSNMGDPIYQKIMAKYQDSYNTFFLDFIRHEMDQGEVDHRINAHLLNFMLVSLGQYLIFLMNRDGDGEIPITHQVIDKMVDDLEFILDNGIYTDRTPR